jgi:catechol 2,3-dioxygenase-like lactoylglutathione lyase family enzyme
VTPFYVQQIDHVELFVADREAAADWYKAVLGLQRLPECEVWAKDPGGPLMISSDGGSTKLALFRGRVQGDGKVTGIRLIAFRVDADGFVDFLERLNDHELTDPDGRVVNPTVVVDHDMAYSIYFRDPDGNHLEVTTYDHKQVTPRLKEQFGWRGTSPPKESRDT